MRFSILIPVYNTEQYLDKCIQSVLVQDFDDFEIIITDDGSIDASREICERYAHKDQRIRFYSRENRGLLATRREQLKLCNGDFVLFLDSDDYWQEGILSYLSAKIDKCNPDLICFGHNLVDDDGNMIEGDIFLYKDEQSFGIDNNIDQFVIDFFENHRLCYLWIKCIKRSIIDIDNSYGQFNDVYGEDLLQSVVPICQAKTVLYLRKAFYNYRQSNNGMGRNLSPSFVVDTMCVRDYLYNYILSNNLGNRIEEVFLKRCFKDIMHRYDFLLKYCKSYREFRYYYTEMKCYPVFQYATKSALNKNIRLLFSRRQMMIRTPFVFYFLWKIKAYMKCC